MACLSQTDGEVSLRQSRGCYSSGYTICFFPLSGFCIISWRGGGGGGPFGIASGSGQPEPMMGCRRITFFFTDFKFVMTVDQIFFLRIISKGIFCSVCNLKREGKLKPLCILQTFDLLGGGERVRGEEVIACFF